MYIFKNERFGLDEFNNVYDIETNEIISKYSRVYFHNMNYPRVKIIDEVSKKYDLKENETLITINPYKRRKKYCFDNLMKINKDDETIILCDGVYERSKETPNLYVNENKKFNIINNHISTIENEEISLLRKPNDNVKRHPIYNEYGYDFRTHRVYSYRTNAYIKTRSLMCLFHNNEKILIKLSTFISSLR